MLSVLRNKNLALLWFGQFVSTLGDWVLVLALPFYIFDLTNSTLATGGMFIATSVPRLLFGSIGGVFADRWNRRILMITADLLRAGILLFILFVHSISLLWIIYAAALLESTISQFFDPAKSAIIPQVVPEEDLLAANSANSLSDSLTRLIGPTLGGSIYGLFGVMAVVSLDISSYLISALLIFLMVVKPKKLPETTTAAENNPSMLAQSAWARLWHDWLDGLKVVGKNQTLLVIFIGISVMMLGEGIIEVLLVAMSKQVLHGNATTLGWIMTAQGVGAIGASLLSQQIAGILQPKYMIMVSLVGVGLMLIAMVNAANFWIALPLMVLLGGLVVWAMVTVQTQMQKQTTDAYRGRVFGAYGTTISLLLLMGMGLASALTGLLGTVPLLDIAGGILLVSGLIFIKMPVTSNQPEALPALQEVLD